MPAPTNPSLAQLDAWILEDIQRRNLNLLNATTPYPDKTKPTMMAAVAETETERAALNLAIFLSRKDHEERERARQAQAAAVAEQRVLEGMFREARDREREMEKAYEREKARAREALRVLEEERAREKARIIEEERTREKARKIMEEEEQERMRREKMEGMKRVLERAVQEERERAREEEARRKAAERVAREMLEARAQEERLKRRVRGGKGGKMAGGWLGEEVPPLGPRAADVRACVEEDARRTPYAFAGDKGVAPERAWHRDPSPYANAKPTRGWEFDQDRRRAQHWDLDLESDCTAWPTEGGDGRRWRETKERRETVVRWEDEGRDAYRRYKEVNEETKRFG